MLLNAVPQVYEYRAKLPAGDHKLSVAFLNEFADPDNPNPNLRKRDILVDYIGLAGLTEPATLPPRPEPIQRLFAAAAAPPPPTAGFFARLTSRPAGPPCPRIRPGISSEPLRAEPGGARWSLTRWMP